MRFYPLYNTIPRHGLRGRVLLWHMLLDRIERRRKRVLIWEEAALGNRKYELI